MKRPSLSPLAPLALALTALFAAVPAQSQHPGSPTEPPPHLAAWTERLAPALPPQAQVRETLTQLPAIRGALAGISLGQARQARLNAGPHEWVLKPNVQRRSERNGPHYTEADLAVEHGVRLPGKRATDEQLGAGEVRIGSLAFEDSWHEAARGLLKAWFDWLREARTAQVLAEQSQLVQQQLSVAQRRVKAGEAARLELMQAEAEAGRASAAWQQSRARERALWIELERRYPGLKAQPPAALPNPDTLPEEPAAWVDRVLDDNHELALAQAHAEHATLLARRAALERRPDPTVGLRAARERGGQEQVVGVYLSLPLGGAARQAEERAALAQADIADQKAADVRHRITSEAWRVALLASEGVAAWQSLDTARQRMAQSAELATRAYTLGETPLGESLQMRRLALDAQLSAESARLDTLENQARLLLDAHLMWTPPEPTP